MINLYCAGGAGTNIGKSITDLDLNIYYIDTSDSNLKGVDSTKVYQIEDTDGAGKNRTITYDNFKNPEEVLIKFKPSNKLNIIMSSLSGGSGSIIAPILTRELIKNDYNTIVVAIDSLSSIKEIDNSIKTLQTYKSFSNSTNKSISIFYIENTSRKEADKHAISFINMMSLLMNKIHTEEFDTSDMYSFINFNTVTDNKPSVSIIDINENTTLTPEKNTTIVSTILLTTNKEKVISEPIPEHLSTCIVTDKNYNNDDIRIDNVLGKLNIIINNLESIKNKYLENKIINKYKDIEVTPSTKDGVVL